MQHRQRTIGSAFIALPGIGGSSAKAGMLEALYVGELVGLVLIWIGFNYCTRVVRDPAEEVSLAAAASCWSLTRTSVGEHDGLRARSCTLDPQWRSFPAVRPPAAAGRWPRSVTGPGT